MIVYGDFGCPRCYLASGRVAALIAVGVDVDWRAVERDPRLPVTGRRPTPAERVALEGDLAELRRFLMPGEELPSAVPGVVPKTDAAVAGYAEAYGAGVAEPVRRVLFASYWEDGMDIGNLDVLRGLLAGPILSGSCDAEPLREFGYAVAPNRGPITTGAYRRLRSWREEWVRLGEPSLPVLLDGGQPAVGGAALDRLAAEISRAGAAAVGRTDGMAGLPPSTPLQPPAPWVSQVGGRWLRALRLGR